MVWCSSVRSASACACASFTCRLSASLSRVCASSCADRSSCTRRAASDTCLAACSAATVAAAVKWSTSAATSWSTLDEGFNAESSACVVASSAARRPSSCCREASAEAAKRELIDRVVSFAAYWRKSIALAEGESDFATAGPPCQLKSCPVSEGATSGDRRIRSGNHDSVIRRGVCAATCWPSPLCATLVTSGLLRATPRLHAPRTPHQQDGRQRTTLPARRHAGRGRRELRRLLAARIRHVPAALRFGRRRTDRRDPAADVGTSSSGTAR